MDTSLIIVLIVIAALVFVNILKPYAKKNFKRSTSDFDIHAIEHTKKTHLTTHNEQKLFYALRKVLGDSYIIHCQTSLIALSEPVESKDRGNAYRKRVDFVITDLHTKILAVIELDDSSHNKPNRQKRDQYVNHALNGIHPFIRLETEKFYAPLKIATRLEKEAQIKTSFHEQLNKGEGNVSSFQVG